MERRDFLKWLAAGGLSLAGCALPNQTNATQQLKSIDDLNPEELTDKLRQFIYSGYDFRIHEEEVYEKPVPEGSDKKEVARRNENAAKRKGILANIEKAKKGLEQILNLHELNADAIILKIENSLTVGENNQLEDFLKQHGLEFVSGFMGDAGSYELQKVGSIENLYLKNEDKEKILGDIRSYLLHRDWNSVPIPKIRVVVDTPIKSFIDYKNNKKELRNGRYFSLDGSLIALYAGAASESAAIYKRLKEESARFDAEIEDPNLLDGYIKKEANAIDTSNFFGRIGNILFYKSLKPELDRLANEGEGLSLEEFHKIMVRKYHANVLYEQLTWSFDLPQTPKPDDWISSEAKKKLCSMYLGDPLMSLAVVFKSLYEPVSEEDLKANNSILNDFAKRDSISSNFILNKFAEILLAEREKFKDRINYDRYDNTKDVSSLLEQFVRLNGDDIKYMSNRVSNFLFCGVD